MSTKRIGEFLVDKKILTPIQVEQILEYGRREKIRFGEAGIRLGILNEDLLARVFGKNYRVDFFHLDPRFFPNNTTPLIEVDTVLRYGAVPLGYKKEQGIFRRGNVLNMGMLDPGRSEALKVIQGEASRAGAKFSRFRVFLVLADQFLDVLESAYGMGVPEIRARGLENIDPTLALFLEERID